MFWPVVLSLAGTALAVSRPVVQSGKSAVSIEDVGGVLQDLSKARVLCTLTPSLPHAEKLYNKAFGVDLPPGSALESESLSVNMDANLDVCVLQGHAVERHAGEALSAGYAGLVQLCSAADVVMVEIFPDDLDTPGGSLKAALVELKKVADAKRTMVVMVRGGDNESGAKLDAWLAENELSDLKESFDVAVLSVAIEPTAEDAEALAICVAEKCKEGTDTETVAQKILEGCEKAENAKSVGLPGFEELQAATELASVKASAELQRSLRPFRSTAESGKIVKNFGKICNDIRGRCLETFTSTVGSLSSQFGVPEDVEFHAIYANSKEQFEADMKSTFERLQARQMDVLTTSAKVTLQRLLLRTLRSEGALPRDRQAALVRQVLYDFSMKSRPLVGNNVAFLNRVYKKLESELTKTAGTFLETPQAQLVTEKRVEKAAKRQQGVKGSRSIKARLDIVSMMNLAGDGSLEGFAAYQAGPFNLIAGFQNENEGDEPMFQIQPKIHFDLSL